MNCTGWLIRCQKTQSLHIRNDVLTNAFPSASTKWSIYKFINHSWLNSNYKQDYRILLLQQTIPHNQLTTTFSTTFYIHGIYQHSATIGSHTRWSRVKMHLQSHFTCLTHHPSAQGFCSICVCWMWWLSLASSVSSFSRNSSWPLPSASASTRDQFCSCLLEIPVPSSWLPVARIP